MKIATIYVLEDVNGEPTTKAAGTIKIVGGIIAATPASEEFARMMQRISQTPINVKGDIISPGQNPDAFLAGLPVAYHGSYMWAVLEVK